MRTESGWNAENYSGDDARRPRGTRSLGACAVRGLRREGECSAAYGQVPGVPVR
jgi:hypothetical protein